MKETPILFTPKMMRAILDGSKTQTRRPLKPQPEHRKGGYWFGKVGWAAEDSIYADMNSGKASPVPEMVIDQCPYGKPGDILIPAIEIMGYDKRYCADVYGQIWSKFTSGWRKLKPGLSKNYLTLTLRLDGNDVTKMVHGLVCRAYHGKSAFDKPAVRHLNGNKLDNTPSNLDWGTYAHNWDDRKHHKADVNFKLTMEIANTIRISDKTPVELAQYYGVTVKSIHRVLDNKTWKNNYPEPVINTPRWVSSITLEIVSVRVERVNNISEADALAEGVIKLDKSETAYGAFSRLWNDIYADKGLAWPTNPWVWVVEFKRIKQ